MIQCCQQSGEYLEEVTVAPASCRYLNDRQDAGATDRCLTIVACRAAVAANCVGHGPTCLLNLNFTLRRGSLAMVVGMTTKIEDTGKSGS